MLDPDDCRSEKVRLDAPMVTSVPPQAAAAGSCGRHAAGPACAQLRALVLLGGAVRESVLSRAIGRSMLDLPVGAGRSLMTLWQEQAATLVGRGAGSVMQIRLFLNKTSTPPVCSDSPVLPRAVVEFDRAEFRGTGGVLRDLSEEYGPDDFVLVGNAYQVILQPLAELVSELSAAMGDIALLADTDGTPSGLQLIRCGALRELSARGFVDFKEQALPLLARSFSVRVVRRPVVAVSIRTLETYITALRLLRNRGASEPVERDPFGEECFSSFAVVEEGADIAATARVHDSVVLRGGRVREGAVVARSVVCGGAIVETGEVVVDRVVGGGRSVGRDET
jgi:hypothetical protein